uniref:cytochrome b n=1 Tax=Halomonas sp. TaxID=1486246 RepID=UPI002620C2EE|nr:cytochrome b [Halomonas sp.]
MWRNTRSGWGLVSILLHWLSAIAIIGLFVMGWWMTGLDYYSPWYHDAPWWHRSIGILILFATLFRLLWRLMQPTPHAHGGSIERSAAALGHLALYVLILAVLISGYLISTAEGKGISVFGWFEMPPLISGLSGQASWAGAVHWYAAVVLIVLAAGHTLAALKHHLMDRQDTLRRMINPRHARRG